MNDQDFHERRRTGIGGSDAAAVCGLSPYQTAHDVWASKKGLVEPKPANMRMNRGNRLEPALLAWYGEETGHRVEKPDKMYRDPDNQHRICHLDGLVYNGSEEPIGIMEAKTVNYDKAYLWGEADDAIPIFCAIQGYHNMAVTSAEHQMQIPWCDFPVMIGLDDWRLYRVEWNDELVTNLFTILDDFWFKNVVGNVPPPIDGSEGAERLLQALYPRHVDREVVADETLEKAAQSFIDLRAEIDVLEVKKQAAENLIREYMNEAAVFKSTAGKFSWKTQQGKVSVTKLIEHYAVPKDVQDACRGKESRIFRTPRRKK